jgi:glycosyltransferase involved in cell wall biosynthesis
MLVRCLAMMRGGGETRHLAWARELIASGVDVDIIAGRPLLFGGPRYRTTEAPVTLLRSPYTRDFVYRRQRQRGFGRLTMSLLRADERWFCQLAWKQILGRSHKPDIVHAHALHQAARFRVGDIAVVINLPGEPNARDAADLQKADALVADGWAARQLPAKLGRPVARIPKGVDAQLFRPDGPSLREALRLTARRVVVTVARLVAIKNVRLLVDAVAIVRQRIPNVHLLVVGDGPEHAGIANRVAECDLRDCVTLVGAVPHSDTPSYYRAADVFALPSDFDNSPNAVLEAMACGLPIVATDAGGVRDFVPDESGGALVRTGDAPALAAALERYLTSGELSRRAGEHNRRKASTDFSWKESARQLRAIYQTAIESRRGTAATSA